jgi:hypothetical protein
MINKTKQYKTSHRNLYMKQKKINLVFNRTILVHRLSSKRVFSSLNKRKAYVKKFGAFGLPNAYKNLLKHREARLNMKKKYNFSYKLTLSTSMKFFLTSFSIFSIASHLTSFSRTWDADYFAFILGKRFKRAIIDPTFQAFNFQRVYTFIKLLMAKNIQCLIYEPRLISRMKAEEIGVRLGEWVPGMLTNKGLWSRLLRSNRIRYFFPLYVVLFLSDPRMINFVREMRILGIPTIGFMQPYISSWVVDYPFLTNLNYRLLNYYLVYLRFQFIQVRKNLLFKFAHFRQPGFDVLELEAE